MAIDIPLLQPRLPKAMESEGVASFPGNTAKEIHTYFATTPKVYTSNGENKARKVT